MIAAAGVLAGWRWPAAATACLLIGLVLFAAAGLYDARTAAREPLSRRSSPC